MTIFQPRPGQHFYKGNNENIVWSANDTIAAQVPLIDLELWKVTNVSEIYILTIGKSIPITQGYVNYYVNKVLKTSNRYRILARTPDSLLKRGYLNIQSESAMFWMHARDAYVKFFWPAVNFYAIPGVPVQLSWLNLGGLGDVSSGSTLGTTIDFRLLFMQADSTVPVDTIVADIDNTPTAQRIVTWTPNSYPWLSLPDGLRYAIDAIDSETGMNLGRSPLFTINFTASVIPQNAAPYVTPSLSNNPLFNVPAANCSPSNCTSTVTATQTFSQSPEFVTIGQTATVISTNLILSTVPITVTTPQSSTFTVTESDTYSTTVVSTTTKTDYVTQDPVTVTEIDTITSSDTVYATATITQSFALDPVTYTDYVTVTENIIYPTLVIMPGANPPTPSNAAGNNTNSSLTQTETITERFTQYVTVTSRQIMSIPASQESAAPTPATTSLNDTQTSTLTKIWFYLSMAFMACAVGCFLLFAALKRRKKNRAKTRVHDSSMSVATARTDIMDPQGLVSVDSLDGTSAKEPWDLKI